MLRQSRVCSWWRGRLLLHTKCRRTVALHAKPPECCREADVERNTIWDPSLSLPQTIGPTRTATAEKLQWKRENVGEGGGMYVTVAWASSSTTRCCQGLHSLSGAHWYGRKSEMKAPRSASRRHPSSERALLRGTSPRTVDLPASLARVPRADSLRPGDVLCFPARHGRIQASKQKALPSKLSSLSLVPEMTILIHSQISPLTLGLTCAMSTCQRAQSQLHVGYHHHPLA